MCDQTTNQTTVGRKLVAGVLLLVVLVAAVAARYKIVLVLGDSMRPTFSTGDIVLVDRCAYGSREPERGDLVVARSHNDWIIKRVVGVPGEEVSVVNGLLYIDGVPYPESNINPGGVSIGPGVLGQERFALLGDNRSLPQEQLIHAIVARPQIIGRVAFQFHFRSQKTPRTVAISPSDDFLFGMGRISNAFRT